MAAGFDIAVTPDHEVWVAPVAESGLSPLSIFSTTGLRTSFTAAFGGFSGTNDVHQLEHFGASATVPLGLVPLLGTFANQNPFWGALTQLAKVAKGGIGYYGRV